MTEKPKLVWVREPCPWCGAKTGTEAEKMCNPPVHCPASGITDSEGFLVQATDESMDAWAAWEEANT